MRAWKANSPFEWVGYYLGGPCHSDHTWRGQRQFVEDLGFATLPVYVGLQGGQGCGHAQLSANAGRVHGEEAVALMKAEGFPALRYCYLDVEPVDTVSTAHQGYVSAWIQAVLDDGTYIPALYIHRKNANVLLSLLAQLLTDGGHHDPARVWVCGGPRNFSLDDEPSKSGVPDAFAWQGELDTSHTFGEVTLSIDRSVCKTATPGQ